MSKVRKFRIDIPFPAKIRFLVMAFDTATPAVLEWTPVL